ncbi:vacuolar protein 14 C-terminal Fig4p binding-domain-containing protein [Tribonema minus]|uniref:Vacuolar protein 14 C-terminal Fig4p binding-domain-containing protein n=1 Tax=Tribonema minus TaxID=303371 RepID=A0A835YJ67_9STRA|nr:vacuolar protein 14 C-terminal Fig4p binding-domain-containing protein [Tribonema minus]
MMLADDVSLAGAAPAESPLAPAILRGLGDRSYDKRKNAALEIEAVVRSLQESRDTDRICSIIALLGQDFATSTNANHRKGGLIGLAATAIGLMSSTKLYLDALLPPVLHCLDDPESRVRYYACESLYNIAKVARQDMLAYFNQIFDGLCKLFADVDMDVKNGSALLDRLIKDIVAESESFDVERFIPLLQKYIRRTNPYIRQLLVGWITVLDSVPDINMVDWLPDFLDGLFNMLSDGNREIRQAADGALAEFLREIKESAFVEYGPMVSILVGQCNSKERSNRLTAITWVQEFIALGGERLLLFYSDLLSAIMQCISDPEDDICAVAGQTNRDLLELVRGTSRGFELSPLLQSLTAELSSDHVPTRMAALHWLNMLLEKAPAEMGRYIEDLLPALLHTLSDESDEVVLLNLQVLARIGLAQSEFQRVLNSIMDVFTEDRRLLEVRGSLIVRKLCLLLNARSIYMALAAVLEGKTDLQFVSLMVQSLNLILLTAAELDEVRRALKASFQPNAAPEDTQVFASLFSCWCHSPVSTFSLCLLAKAYDLSAAVVSEFSDVEVTVGFLMQVDKLVQLLESPIFLHLRLQLLDVSAPSYPALVKSLYGLLMLLPQSAAFRTLRDRLDAACALRQNLAYSTAPPPAQLPPAPSSTGTAECNCM